MKNESINGKDNYIKRVDKFNGLLSMMNKPLRQLLYSKALLIIFTFVVMIVVYTMKSLILAGITLVGFVVGYLYLEIKHKKILDYKKNLTILKEINAESIKRYTNEWVNFSDNGSDFDISKHPYAADLDIIGKDSLYQWTSVCETPWGRRKLASRLLFPLKTIADIHVQQEAVEELAPQIKFRQRLQMETKKMDVSENEFNRFLEWTKVSHPLYLKKWFILLVRLLPMITLTTILLGPIMTMISVVIPIVLLIIQSLMLFMNSSQRSHYLGSIYKSNKSIKKLITVLDLLESYHAKSTYLKNIIKDIQIEDQILPSKEIKKLSSIASNISNRGNMIYFVINILLLWDLRSCISLEKWKDKSGQHVASWINAIGEFEALSSIALIKYDHPTWIMPQLQEKSSVDFVKGSNIGHPLIGSKCVTNRAEFSTTNPIALITGSNMSGKSTYLRTIGINLILSYIAAPVFASEFSCIPMKVVTCMRISDDLQQNISSFYGEILRVKMIVDKVKEGEKVFFLLDEIFKGTNSADRHTAAKTIIHNLDKYGAIGLVSTHDLELDVLEKETQGKVLNYHFEEHYEEEKIIFDYKLKEGVSTTRNAIYLIKAAGIDL